MRLIKFIAIAGAALAGSVYLVQQVQARRQAAEDMPEQMEGQNLPSFAAVEDQPADAVLMEEETPSIMAVDEMDEDEEDVEAVIEQVVAQPHPDTAMAHAFASAVEERVEERAEA